MPRNHEKYAYTELAIPRNSVWFPLLAAEAEAKGQPLAQVALERLAASYLTASALGPTASRPLPAPWPPMLGPAAAAAPEDDSDLELDEQRAASNAAAFLDNNGSGFL